MYICKSLISLKTKRHKKLIKRWKKNLKVDLHSIHSNSSLRKSLHIRKFWFCVFFCQWKYENNNSKQRYFSKIVPIVLTAQSAKTAKTNLYSQIYTPTVYETGDFAMKKIAGKLQSFVFGLWFCNPSLWCLAPKLCNQVLSSSLSRWRTLTLLKI